MGSGMPVLFIAAGFQAVMVLRPKMGNFFFYYLLLLIDFDGINASVFPFISESVYCGPEILM